MDRRMIVHHFKTKGGALGESPKETKVSFPSTMDELEGAPLFKNEESSLQACRSSFVISAQRKLREDPETFRSEGGELQGFTYGAKYTTVKVTVLTRGDFSDEQVASLEASIENLRWVD